IGYINDILTIRSSSIRISALELLRILYLNNTSAGALSIIQDKLAAKDTEGMSSKLERFLFYKLSKSGLVPKIHDDYYMYTDAEISEMFLQNLKTNTHWVVKRLQIEILLNNALNNHITEGFHTAMHFCNLLKVSGTEAVRNSAGAALLKLMPVLTSDQINDIAVELLRALELDGYQYASYIPYYLGQVMLYLSKVELEEFIDDMLEKIKHSNPQLNSLLLRTAGIYIVSFLKKHSSLSDVSTSESVVLKRMILLVLNSLADFNQQIKQAAFALLGKDIFGSKQLTLEQKYGIFALIAKKAITLITDVKEQELQFLSNSSTFNHIYRFINEYKLNIGEIRIEKADKIAIYNGIFDPFTVYHKEIARQIRDMGFEVHLSVDEFAWERRSMPNLIRRSIINMSIADEFNMYLFPEDFPLNTDNSRDVQRLLKAFPGCEVYIVLDSVELLSGCRRLIKKNIDGLCYILLDRKSPHIFTDEDNKLNKLLHGVGDKVLKLQLLEIGKLHEEESVQQESAEKVNALTDVDPLARRFIKEFGMYKAEPLLKSQIKSISLESEVLEKYDSEAVRAILSSFGISRASFERLERLAARPGSKLLLLQSIKRGNVVLGFSVFHKLNSGEVYDEFGSIEAANYIYDNASGNIVLIDGIFIRENTGYHKLDQMVLTETLSYCLANEYEYCIYCDKTEAGVSASFMELLGNFGFMRINAEGCDKVIFAVDMSSPCTLYMDIRNVLKEPYRSSDIMQKVIGDTRKSLMKALVELYPGKLVLSFDRGMLYDNLVKKICGVNQVSTQAGDGKLGSKLCVPYGNILHKYIVPNTITKSLHTEKYFEPGLRQYSIGAFPYYLDLETQFKMVSSFNKPIILVDDLLNKGYRLKALEPMLSNQKIRVEKVIVGILSNRGKDLANIMGLEVDCAYYIPKLKAWFNESDMYPFIGGDAVWRGIYPKRNLLPSVNLILPYAYPTFLTGTTKEAVYNLSITALENSYRILCALEDEYQRYNERMLTLALLGDVLTIPRCPDHGEDMEYNISLNPSHYLKNDIEVLKRIEPYGK
ncbi:MAG: cytidyltransferase, partial [Bacillota bacterium]